MSPLELVKPEAAPETAPLSVRGLTVTYREKPALFSVDATFAPGAMTAIIGPNGAGKSTLMKAALGIVRPLAGEARFYGRGSRRRATASPTCRSARASTGTSRPARSTWC
jgi:manganese/zinc/iron transport system ATP- binding protein